MPERRQGPRHRVLQTGKIIFEHRRCVVDCTVRNLSNMGALLRVQSTLGIPEHFDLSIAERERRCVVTWKTDESLGIAFL